jgi:threonine dehydrogenase-like Zn-dependent dehydrogenase
LNRFAERGVFANGASSQITRFWTVIIIMRAGALYGSRDIKVEEFDTPTPGPGEVLVEVKAAGICGSDLHYHRSDAPSNETGEMKGGPELSGRIAAVGEGVKNRKVGERIGKE